DVSGVLRLLCSSDDVDDLAAALRAELDSARLKSEQRVVAATADVHAGVEVGAALADDNLAGVDLLAAETLDAKSLGVGVTTVAGGACALLMCHVLCLFWLLDAGDLDARELLAVALTLLVAGLVLVLLDDELRAAEVADDLGGDLDLGQLVGVGGHRGAVDEEHCGQLDLLALSSLNTIELNDRADLDLLLPPTGAHYCVNHLIPVSLGSGSSGNLTGRLCLRSSQV